MVAPPPGPTYIYISIISSTQDRKPDRLDYSRLRGVAQDAQTGHTVNVKLPNKGNQWLIVPQKKALFIGGGVP